VVDEHRSGQVLAVVGDRGPVDVGRAHHGVAHLADDLRGEREEPLFGLALHDDGDA
jgi:hypothetical protein